MGDTATQLQENDDVIEEQVEETQSAPQEAEQAPEAEEESVDIVLEGEPEPATDTRPKKPNRVRHMRERIKELNRDTREKDQTIKTLESRLEELESRLADTQAAPSTSASQSTLGQRPKPSDYGYDIEAYDEAMLEWAMQKAVHTQSQTQQHQAVQQQADAAISAHYERANQLNVADYEAAEDATVNVLGAELVQSIQANIPQSEKVLYFLGKNPDKLGYFRELFATAPGRATFELGQMSSKLTIIPKRTTPPDPDIPIKGGGGHNGNPKYQQYLKELLDVYKSNKPGVLNAARDVRRRAAADGVELPLNPQE